MSCQDNLSDEQVRRKLYKAYKDGEISECWYGGELAYSAARNAYDAGGTIYDREGNTAGRCNFGWGSADSICTELQDCRVIYRVENNIWGQPAVDAYGLKR